ncbi:hypothetical protein VNO80_02445 [Phaseolus coccineus]|uniref:Uncharacterized protein n=1 Tax=Phaseolus coccineus TaxID=3886 RepID=A0AAN9NPQ6_PHACN
MAPRLYLFVLDDSPGQAADLVAEQTESDLLVQSRYEWVYSYVIENFSKYQWSSMVGSFVASVPMLKTDVEVGIVFVERCSAIDSICHD